MFWPSVHELSTLEGFYTRGGRYISYSKGNSFCTAVLKLVRQAGTGYEVWKTRLENQQIVDVKMPGEINLPYFGNKIYLFSQMGRFVEFVTRYTAGSTHNVYLRIKRTLIKYQNHQGKPWQALPQIRLSKCLVCQTIIANFIDGNQSTCIVADVKCSVIATSSLPVL